MKKDVATTLKKEASFRAAVVSEMAKAKPAELHLDVHLSGSGSAGAGSGAGGGAGAYDADGAESDAAHTARAARTAARVWYLVHIMPLYTATKKNSIPGVHAALEKLVEAEAHALAVVKPRMLAPDAE